MQFKGTSFALNWELVGIKCKNFHLYIYKRTFRLHVSKSFEDIFGTFVRCILDKCPKYIGSSALKSHSSKPIYFSLKKIYMYFLLIYMYFLLLVFSASQSAYPITPTPSPALHTSTKTNTLATSYHVSFFWILSVVIIQIFLYS